MQGLMTTPSPSVQAALASLQERWGEAAPRWGGEVLGSLAIAPRPVEPVEPGGETEIETGLPDRSFGGQPARGARALSRGEQAIPSGFRALDSILGLGGLPRAATTAIRGDGSSGKTTLALKAIASVQEAGGIAAYLDLARSLDPVEAAARGVQLNWLVVLTPESLTEALSMAAMLLQDRTVDLILLDLPSVRTAAPAGPAERLDRLSAMARRAGVQMLVLEPPGLPSALSSVLTQIAALRLELTRRAWIRLGRDVVGQRTQVRVERDRFGPPGRAAEIRILYADGGALDACLARGELLRENGEAPPGRHPRSIPVPQAAHQPSSRNSISADATSPPLLASLAPAPGPRSISRAVPAGADRAGRPSVVERSGSGRQPVGTGAWRPDRDAPGRRSSARP